MSAFFPDDSENWTEMVNDAPMTLGEFLQKSPSEWLAAAREVVRDGARAPLRLFARLCGVLMLAAVGRSVGTERFSPESASLLDTVSALAVFATCAAPILALTEIMQRAVSDSRAYMLTFVPVFASVLTASGQAGGAAVYGGVFFAVCTVMADVLCRVGFPAIRMLLAVNAAGAASDTPALERVNATACRWLNWLLSLCATVFGALMALQSVFAASADTLALRTGKFIAGSAVPVVGHAISDAMGTVLAGMKLVKGTVGFAAIAAVMASFIPALVMCFACCAVLSIGSIAASALGNEKCARLLSGLAECVKLYISMGFFYDLLLTMGTLLMVMIGNGG